MRVQIGSLTKRCASENFTLPFIRNAIFSEACMSLSSFQSTFDVNRNSNRHALKPALLLRMALVFFLAAVPVRGQLITFSKQDLIDYTSQNPFDRFPDGRPKIPDALLRQARELSSEEVWAVMEDKNYKNQYADGFRILHPDNPMAG